MQKIKIYPVYLIPLAITLWLLVIVLSRVQADSDYEVYLPLIVDSSGYPPPTPTPHIQKGIAMVQPQYQQDLTNVGADWYYTWDVYPKVYEDTKHIPMSRCGLFDDNFPIDYSGYVIVFNEPLSPEPNGCGISVAVGLQRYTDFVTHFPDAKIVFGNSTYGCYWWEMEVLSQAKANGVKMPAIHGMHAYYIPGYSFSWWSQYLVSNNRIVEEAAGKQFDVWITEFAHTSGDAIVFQQMLDFIATQPKIKRVAPFTNRPMYDQDWWPDGWLVELFNANGMIMPLGEVYRDWNP